MLEIRQHARLSDDRDVLVGGVVVARYVLDVMAMRARFELDGVVHEVRRDSWRRGGTFVHEVDGRVVGRAERSRWALRFEIDVDGTSYRLAPPRLFSRRFELGVADVGMGHVEQAGRWPNEYDVHLSESIPLPQRLFAAALLVLVLRR